MEKRSREGDRPVTENPMTPRESLSNTGHLKPCVKPRGPPRKPKYDLVTDSELVPRGKGEKNPYEGSEIEPATLSLIHISEPTRPY